MPHRWLERDARLGATEVTALIVEQCGRTGWAERLCPRPLLVNGLAVHQHCYRLLAAPHVPEPAPCLG